MKHVRVIVHEPSINKLVGGEVLLQLDESANLVDAINEVDRLIVAKGGFPMHEYQSLLHMVYNPIENRFLKQVAVAAYRQSENMINLRIDPRQKLPSDVTVVLIPAGGCISEWEEALDSEKFLKAVQKG